MNHTLIQGTRAAPQLLCWRSTCLLPPLVKAIINLVLLQEGTPVLVLPALQPATVKSLDCNGSQVAAVARAGDSADVTLSGLPDESAVGTGSVICHPKWRVPMATKLTARVAVLDVPIPILTGQSVSQPIVHAPRYAYALLNMCLLFVCITSLQSSITLML